DALRELPEERRIEISTWIRENRKDELKACVARIDARVAAAREDETEDGAQDGADDGGLVETSPETGQDNVDPTTQPGAASEASEVDPDGPNGDGGQNDDPSNGDAADAPADDATEPLGEDGAVDQEESATAEPAAEEEGGEQSPEEEEEAQKADDPSGSASSVDPETKP
ncbi:MAG: hypothetical protein AAFU55_16860, partial [Pseudomonadota bacterium]